MIVEETETKQDTGFCLRSGNQRAELGVSTLNPQVLKAFNKQKSCKNTITDTHTLTKVQQRAHFVTFALSGHQSVYAVLKHIYVVHLMTLHLYINNIPMEI